MARGDLRLLRVACRVVERRQQQQAEEEEEPPARLTRPAPDRDAATTASSDDHTHHESMERGSTDATRIVPVRPSAALAQHADLMLGLRTLVHHGDGGEHPRPTPPTPHRKRPRRPQPTATAAKHHAQLLSPRLEKLVSSLRPTLLPSIASAQRQGNENPRLGSALATDFAAFVGRKRQRDDDERSAPVTSVPCRPLTSPTSVWEAPTRATDAETKDAPADEAAAPLTLSASATASSTTTTTTTMTMTMTTIASAPAPLVSTWRIPSLRRPLPQPTAPTSCVSVPLTRFAASARSNHEGSRSDPTLTSLDDRASFKRPRLALPPSLSTVMTSRPRAEKWRREMPPQDRETTRGRLRRGMHRQCHGDYETLVAVLAAMEEELLHLKTTSRDHYALQALALHDRIASVPIEPSGSGQGAALGTVPCLYQV